MLGMGGGTDLSFNEGTEPSPKESKLNFTDLFPASFVQVYFS